RAPVERLALEPRELGLFLEVEEVDDALRRQHGGALRVGRDVEAVGPAVGRDPELERARLQVADLEPAAQGGADDAARVRGEAKRVAAEREALDRAHELVARRLEDADLLVEPARRDEPPVGRDRERADLAALSFDRIEVLAARDVKDAHLALLAGGDRALAAREEAHGRRDRPEAPGREPGEARDERIVTAPRRRRAPERERRVGARAEDAPFAGRDV